MLKHMRSLAIACLLCSAAQAAVQPVRLRCEYRRNPEAVESAHPRLGWALTATANGEAQTAWRILVASSQSALRADRGDLWDSGKVASAGTIQTPYAGKPLRSGMACWWKVRVWGKDGRPSAWSEPAYWGMGLLSVSDWKARWIGAASPAASPLLRREFRLDKPVRRAVAYTSGLGQFELRLNGRKAGADVLEPAWTNYRKTVFYTAHDVTALLKPGMNAAGVMLGNGMYNVTGGRYVKFKGSFGQPKLIFQLEIEFTDGSGTRIVSDGNWRVSPGPVRFTCIYGGEDYDARHEQPGWDAPGFDDAAWQPAAEVTPPEGRLAAQMSPPVRVIETFKTVRVTQPKPGVRVYDLGQNFSGWPRVRARGPAGATVKMIPGELLDAGGLVSQRSSGSPVWFSYTLKGQGVEDWRPRFSYYGFRYVQVEGDATVESLEGEFIHSSAERVGEFSCSNELFNRIHRLVDAAVRSNLNHVLTDCPHREKLGWLEVPHLMGPSIIYGYDLASFYAKVARDMAEAQLDNGLVPDIAPEYTVFKGGFRDSPEWGSAAVVVPWLAYRAYGDRRPLEANYEGMKRYVAYLGSRATGHIVSHGLGDWYDVGPKPPGPSQLTPLGVTATAFYYHDLKLLARIGALLGRKEDSARYNALAGEVRAAFNARYFDPAAHRYATGSQAANAMPLVMELAEPEWRQALVEAIAGDVRARGGRITAGDVGHRFALVALAEGGRSDVIFDIASRSDGPGYGYQLKQGATTLTEAWDANPASSQNHCMLGHIEEWFYGWLAGLRPDPDAVAFDRVIIDPQVVGDVTWAKAVYESPRGRVAVEWRLHGAELSLDVQLPPGVSATVIPARTKVGAGAHRFSVKR